MSVQFHVDENLLNEAFQLGRFKTLQETLEVALREFIARKKQLEVINLFGNLDPDADYDYKKGRKK